MEDGPGARRLRPEREEGDKVQKVIASADDPGQAGFLKTQIGQEFSTVLSRHGDDFRLDGGRNDYRPRPFLRGLVKNAGAMFIAFGCAAFIDVAAIENGLGRSQIGRASCRERVGQYV